MASLLEAPAEDAEDLARQILTRIHEMQASRDLYMVLLHDPDIGPRPVVFGPYGTPKAAQKAIGTDVVGISPRSTGGVFKVVRPSGVS